MDDLEREAGGVFEEALRGMGRGRVTGFVSLILTEAVGHLTSCRFKDKAR